MKSNACITKRQKVNTSTGQRSRIADPGLRVVLLFGLFVLPITGCDKVSGASGKSKTTHKKVCIIGCDGMDPKLVRQMIDEGRLPNLARLEREGGFRPLGTSIPPQSPVAWSNFITGAGPGVHGIFDFIHRDPGKQAAPYFSTNRIVDVDRPDPLKIGQYAVPKEMLLPWVKGAENELLRRGTPFWEYLDERGIPVQMYKLPANYPPSKSSHGHACCLAGMGVPDAFGSQGIFQHFTTKPGRDSKSPEGYKLHLRQTDASGAFSGRIWGPPNEMHVKAADLFVDLKAYHDPVNKVAKLVIVNQNVIGDEEIELILDEGQWSDWTDIRFLKTPVGPTFSVMARFLLQKVRPDVEIYMTPLNFIPAAPEIVFSEPPGFATEIADAIGPYHTQGFAEAFNARKAKLLSDEEYHVQADLILEESLRMMDYALDRYEDGVLFFYFSSTDLQAHIFWWDSDARHPFRTPAQAKKYMSVIEDLYVRMDDAVGRCRAKLGEDVTYIVMSDHGFANFGRCVGLCTWLRNEGYLFAKQSAVLDADWSKTRAYGLGINGLYLNLKGREKHGIVDPSEKDALLTEISQKLLDLKDPITGQKVIRRIYRADECYSGPEAVNAPDLIIGYDRNYRASWKTCIGEFDSDVIFDNDNAWSADHCMAHDLVPGIVFSNRAILADAPELIDLAPSILSIYGVTAPSQMTGVNIIAAPPDELAAR